MAEHVQPRPVHRIGDERFRREVCRFRMVAPGQPVTRGDHQHGTIVEQLLEHDAGQVLGVGRHHQIGLAPDQRGQRGKGEARADVDVHLRPVAAERVERGQQPVEAGVAFDRDVHPPAPAGGGAAKLLLHRLDLRQHGLGEAQKSHPGGRQPQGPRLAQEQRHARLRLQRADLVGQRRLRDVEHLGRAAQAALVVDRADRAQVAQFKVHEHLS